MSSPSEPVETTWMPRSTSASPIFMIEPLPNCFSICERAAWRAFALFSSILGASEVPLEITLSIGIIPSISCWKRWGQACGSPGSWRELARSSHQPGHHTEDLQPPARADHRVRLVRRLQHELVALPLQVLHGELVVHDRHHDLAHVGVGLLLHHQQVTL